jgi:hypothetical protein
LFGRGWWEGDLEVGEQLGRRPEAGGQVARMDPLEVGLGYRECGPGRRELGLDDLEFGLGRLALRIDGLAEVPMEDAQAIRDQRKGLLQLDLLGRRADHQGLLQPASKLRVVSRGSRGPMGCPGNSCRRTESWRRIVRSSARRQRKPCAAMSSQSLLPEALGDPGWNQANRWSIQGQSARTRDSGGWT